MPSRTCAAKRRLAASSVADVAGLRPAPCVLAMLAFRTRASMVFSVGGCDDVPRLRLAAPDVAAARAARGDHRRRRARDVRDRLLPPLVPAGALRRPLPRRGE